jgi:hypothetical protein
MVDRLQQAVMAPAFEGLHARLLQGRAPFEAYQQEMGQFLAGQAPGLDLAKFRVLMQAREGQLDDILAETMAALYDKERHQQLLEDYERDQEEEEKYKLMTIKSSKKPESKTVKDTIFSAKPPPLAEDFRKPVQPKKKKESAGESGSVLHPDLLLTIKPIRKQA